MLLFALSLMACSENELNTYNTAPEVSITAPEDGLEFGPSQQIEFEGVVWDDQQSAESLSIVWTSSVDGELGTSIADTDGFVYFPWTGLSEGLTHAITLTAFDIENKSAYDTITVQTTGVYGAPALTLIGPYDGEEFEQGAVVPIVASATDDEQDCSTLSIEVLVSSVGSAWTGTPAANCAITTDLYDLDIGQHQITVTATDDDGNTASESVQVTILENAIPAVSVVSPLDGSSFWTSDIVVLEGLVSDDTTASGDLVVSWSSDRDGALLGGNPDSSGLTAGSATLSEGVHVVTLTAIDEGSESVVIEVIDPLNHDGDGDGWTENDGDCDDTDSSVHPGLAELCDTIDNDCDTEINEDWADTYEPNDTETTPYDLGEVDDGFLWVGDQLAISGLSINEPNDEDWFLFDVDDDWYDNANFSVTVQSLPTGGTWVLELWDMNGTPAIEQSYTSNSSMSVGFTGDIFDDGEDDWAIRIYALTWPSDTSGCTQTYQILIST